MDISGIGIGANYYNGPVPVGGRIYLEADGVTFKPDKVNFSHKDIKINYSDIRGAEPKKILFGTVNNGLIIYTTDDKQHKFVSQSAKDIAAYIRSKISL